MTTTALLDADIVAYALAAKSQRAYRWPGLDDTSVAADDWDNLPERIDRVVSDHKALAKADNLIVCLSCPSSENWRLDVLPSYKANRAGVIKPVHLAAVKAYLAETYESYSRPRLEADDIMGILSTHPTLVKGKKVIVSEDKDMKTIPGWLLNPAKDRAAYVVTDAAANHWHLTQTLVGDTTDGYTGCPGFGKRHRRLNVPEPLTWAEVRSFYEARGLTEADALVQARVARILRHTDYDFKNKEVILWTPS